MIVCWVNFVVCDWDGDGLFGFYWGCCCVVGFGVVGVWGLIVCC